jgi:hypothetical protein
MLAHRLIAYEDQGVTSTPTTPTSFTCAMEIPISIGEETYRYVPVTAVFRRISSDAVDGWLMSNGAPRSDRDVASDVLIEVLNRSDDDDRELRNGLNKTSILNTDRAAALLVSTFLSELPRPEKVMVARGGERMRKVETRWFLPVWGGVAGN